MNPSILFGKEVGSTSFGRKSIGQTSISRHVIVTSGGQNVRTIQMKGITRCKLTMISDSAVCKKFLGQIVSYLPSLQISNSH